MSRALERRLAKLEDASCPFPASLRHPACRVGRSDLERILAEHDRPDLPFPSVIVLVGATKEDCR